MQFIIYTKWMKFSFIKSYFYDSYLGKVIKEIVFNGRKSIFTLMKLEDLSKQNIKLVGLEVIFT